MQIMKLRYLSKTLVSISISISSKQPISRNFLNSNQIYTNPTSHPIYFSIGSSSFSSVTCRSSLSLHSRYKVQIFNFGLPKSFTHYISSRTEETTPDGHGNQVSEIIDLIVSDGNDLESKLNVMCATFSADSLAVILGILNTEKVSALRFFCWVRNNWPKLCCDSDVCSLVVDNCGLLGDYDAMFGVLREFASEEIDLTDKAFRFLVVSDLKEDSAKQSVRRVVELLREVGGSCRVSGVRALIEMFNSLGSFEMAKFVIDMTGWKESYCNSLIKVMCQRLDFRTARKTLDEMRQMGFYPSVYSYNVLVSSLYKNGNNVEAREILEEMKETGCPPPDSLTFEIFISKFCQQRRFDLAFEFLDQMVSVGLEPRLLTHAAFINAFFKSQRYEEAHSYVVRSSNYHKSSSNVNYSLLAKLHLKKGNLIIARDILFELMDMGLRPNSHVYTKVLKQLQKSGRGDLARDLQRRFSSLS